MCVMYLVFCPSCSSQLLAPQRSVGYDDQVMIARRCPECGLEDVVTTTPVAAAAWARRELAISGSLRGLADALADGLPVELSEIVAS
jgi:hypothetical protein